MPVEVEPKAIVPVPAASTVKLSFVPEVITERASPEAAAAPFTKSPVATDAVEASTFKTGLVVPLAPTAKALATFQITVNPANPPAAFPTITAPVETPPIVTVPVPFASIVMLSLVPEESTAIASPEAAAADFIFNPVAAEAVDASILNVGFVVPFGPTAKALAEFEVSVREVPTLTAPVPIVVLRLIVPDPLDSINKLSLVPEDCTSRFTPEPAANPSTKSPVAAEASEVSTTKVGLVAPLGTTAKAAALEPVRVNGTEGEVAC